MPRKKDNSKKECDSNKKEKITLNQKLRSLDSLSEKINKAQNKVVCGRIDKYQELRDKLTIDFIPTPSIDVNKAINDTINGGIPKGRTTLIAGFPDSGKTSYILETIALNQKKDPNFVALWIESEHSLKLEYIINTFGIDPKRFYFSEPSKNLAAEDILDMVEGYLSTGYIDLVCINSLKCLVMKKEYTDSMNDQNVAISARLNSKMMRKFTSLVAESNTAYVLITHLSTDIGKMFGDPYTVTGGYAIKFGAMLELDFRRRSIAEKDPISKEEGVKIGVTIKKNHCVPERFPYLKTEYYALYGQGIDKYIPLIQNCLELGILNKKGSYFFLCDDNGNPILDDNNKEIQWLGKTKLRNFLKDNDDFTKALEDKINSFGKSNIERLSDEEVEEIKKQEEASKKIADDLLEDKEDTKEMEKQIGDQ